MDVLHSFFLSFLRSFLEAQLSMAKINTLSSKATTFSFYKFYRATLKCQSGMKDDEAFKERSAYANSVLLVLSV